MEYTFNIKYDKCIQHNIVFNIGDIFTYPLCFLLEKGKFSTSLDTSFLFVNKINNANKYYKSINVEHNLYTSFNYDMVKTINNPNDYILSIRDMSFNISAILRARKDNLSFMAFSQGVKNKAILNEYISIKNNYTRYIDTSEALLFKKIYSNSLILNKDLILKPFCDNQLILNGDVLLKERYSNKLLFNSSIIANKVPHNSLLCKNILLNDVDLNDVNINNQILLNNNIDNVTSINNDIILKEYYINKININTDKILSKSSRILNKNKENILIYKSIRDTTFYNELLLKNKYNNKYSTNINRDLYFKVLNKNIIKYNFNINFKNSIKNIYNIHNDSSVDFKINNYKISKNEFKLLDRINNKVNKNEFKLLDRINNDLNKNEFKLLDRNNHSLIKYDTIKSLYKNNNNLSKDYNIFLSNSLKDLSNKKTYSLAEVIKKKIFKFDNVFVNTNNRNVYKIENILAKGGLNRYLSINTFDLMKINNNKLYKLEYIKRINSSNRPLHSFDSNNLLLENDSYKIKDNNYIIMTNRIGKGIFQFQNSNIFSKLSSFKLDNTKYSNQISKLNNNMFKDDILNINKESASTYIYDGNFTLFKPKPKLYLDEYLLYCDKTSGKLMINNNMHLHQVNKEMYKDDFYILFNKNVNIDIYTALMTRAPKYKYLEMNENVLARELHSKYININNITLLKDSIPKYGHISKSIYTKKYSKGIYNNNIISMYKDSNTVNDIDLIFSVAEDNLSIDITKNITASKYDNRIHNISWINMSKDSHKNSLNNNILNVCQDEYEAFINDIVNVNKYDTGIFEINDIMANKDVFGISEINNFTLNKDSCGSYIIDIIKTQQDDHSINIIKDTNLIRDGYGIFHDDNVLITKAMKHSFFQYNYTWVNKYRHNTSLTYAYPLVSKNVKDSYFTYDNSFLGKNIKDSYLTYDNLFINKYMHHSSMVYENLFMNKNWGYIQIDNILNVSQHSRGIFENTYILNMLKDSSGININNENPFAIRESNPILTNDAYVFAKSYDKSTYISDTYMPIDVHAHEITINKHVDNTTLIGRSISSTNDNDIFANADIHYAEYNSALNLSRDIKDSYLDYKSIAIIPTRCLGGGSLDYDGMWSHKDIKDSSVNDNFTINKNVKDTNLFNVGEMVDVHHFGPSRPDNVDSGIIDELILPHKDYKYSDMIDILLQPDGTINMQYIKRYDPETGEYTVTLPVENPIGMYADVGRDYLDVDVSILDMVTYAAVDTWKENMFRYMSMSAQDSLRDIMMKLHEHIINIVLDRDRYREAIRCLQLFRWYAEMAILNNCEYVLKFDTQKIAVDYYNKSLGLLENFIAFNNMEISDHYILEPIDTSKMCTMTIKSNSLTPNYPLNLSFKLYNINTSSSISIIEDGGTKIKKYEPGVHDIDLEFKDMVILRFIPTEKNQSINIANVAINNMTMRGFTTTYKGTFGETNKVMQDLLDRLLVIGEASSDMKETLKDVAPVTVAIDTMMKYFELHHENKLKGKRLITKK